MSLRMNYAQALYSVAEKDGTLDVVLGELKSLAPFFDKKSPALKLFTSPIFNEKEKLDAAQKIESSLKVSKLVSRFLRIMVKRGRADCFTDVVEEFDALYVRSRGGVSGLIWTSVLMSDQEVGELEKVFTKKIGKPVTLKPKEDSNLIAGIRVVVDGVTYDRSIRNQLDRIRMSFLEGQI